MTILPTPIPDVKLLEPRIFGDTRGWFYESYNKKTLLSCGIDTVFVQDNRSFSAKKGTLRGLHFQLAPHAQAKLLCCTRGELLDVAVDLRKGSPTYLQHVAVVLSAENKRMLFIPKGFAHGFLTRTDNVEVLYKVDDYYDPQSERNVRFDDPQIAVSWGVDAPILSDKDQNAPWLAASDVNFQYGGNV